MTNPTTSASVTADRPELISDGMERAGVAEYFMWGDDCSATEIVRAIYLAMRALELSPDAAPSAHCQGAQSPPEGLPVHQE